MCAAFLARSIYFGVETLLFFTGRSILSNNKLAIAPLLPLTIVSHWYVSLLTMDVVVPPAPWVVAENKDLLGLGFRFVIPSLNLLPVMRSVGNRSLTRFKIPWDPNYFVVRPDIVKVGKVGEKFEINLNLRRHSYT